MVIKFNDYPDFKPDLTPQQMFDLGIVGGSYFRDIKSPITGKSHSKEDLKPFVFLDKIDKDKLISQEYNKQYNRFKVTAGSSYSYWIEKGWINEKDAHRGWIHWYCYFYMGRRSDDDVRQITRWKNFASKKSGRFRIRFQNIINRLGLNNKEVSPVIQQNLLEWAVDSTKMLPSSKVQ